MQIARRRLALINMEYKTTGAEEVVNFEAGAQAEK